MIALCDLHVPERMHLQKGWVGQENFLVLRLERYSRSIPRRLHPLPALSHQVLMACVCAGDCTQISTQTSSSSLIDCISCIFSIVGLNGLSSHLIRLVTLVQFCLDCRKPGRALARCETMFLTNWLVVWLNVGVSPSAVALSNEQGWWVSVMP